MEEVSESSNSKRKYIIMWDWNKSTILTLIEERF